MSRIGRLPVKILAGVTVSVSPENLLTVKGPKGELSEQIDKVITVKVVGDQVEFTRNSEEKSVKAKHGLYRALCNNMVTGVTQGFEKGLIIKGVGYKAVKQGKKVTFTVGYAHTVEVSEPDGITIDVVNPNEVLVKGANKTTVGQCAADIRNIKKPEPYHGYGIRYKDEQIKMKVGKTGK